MSTQTDAEYLRPSQSAHHISVGLSSLWRKSKTDPDFPKPIKLGPMTTVFKRSELDQYVESKRTSAAAPKAGVPNSVKGVAA